MRSCLFACILRLNALRRDTFLLPQASRPMKVSYNCSCRFYCKNLSTINMLLELFPGIVHVCTVHITVFSVWFSIQSCQVSSFQFGLFFCILYIFISHFCKWVKSNVGDFMREKAVCVFNAWAVAWQRNPYIHIHSRRKYGRRVYLWKCTTPTDNLGLACSKTKQTHKN